MDNPFELIYTRLESIEEKLSILISESKEDSAKGSVTWLDNQQMSKYSGFSISALARLRAKGMPFYKIGGKILYKKNEVDEFLEEFKELE